MTSRVVGQPRPPLTKRMRRGHWIAIDFVVAGFLALCALAEGFHAVRADISAHSVATAVVYVVVVFLAVGLRRLGPLPALGMLAAVVALAWMSAMVGTASVALIGMAYVLYLVTVTSTRRTGIAALGLSLAEVFGIVVAIHKHVMPVGPALGFPGTFGLIVGWLIGYSVRQRRAYIEVLQVQAASSAVAQERLRIARELHDVVAHSMSVIAVQAGFGQYVMDTSPADTREALGAIQATSREALAELRRMLAVLRQQDGTATAAPLAPECGLAELDRLVSRTGLAGVQVSLTLQGASRELPAGIDMSAFRIIQESLTNVVRHAGGGARCVVTVSYDQDTVTIEVADDGGGRDPRQSLDRGHSPGLPGASSCSSSAGVGETARPGPCSGGLPGVAPPYPYFTGSGHGLIGMRERVQLCGGILNAGPLAAGGFRVWARLPLPALVSAAAPVPGPVAASEPELEFIQ